MCAVNHRAANFGRGRRRCGGGRHLHGGTVVHVTCGVPLEAAGTLVAQTVRADSTVVVPGAVRCNSLRQQYIRLDTPHTVIGVRGDAGRRAVYTLSGSRLYAHQLGADNRYLSSSWVQLRAGEVPRVLDILQTADATFICGYFAGTPEAEAGFVARISVAPGGPAWVTISEARGGRARRLLPEGNAVRVFEINESISQEMQSYQLDMTTGVPRSSARWFAPEYTARMGEVIALPWGYAAVGGVRSALESSTTWLWLATFDSQLVPMASNTYLQDLPDGRSTAAIAIVSDGQYLYVAGYGTGVGGDFYLLKYTLAGQLLKTSVIDVDDARAEAIDLTEAAGQLYLTGTSADGAKFRCVQLDAADLTVTEHITTANPPGAQRAGAAVEPTSAGVLLATTVANGYQMFLHTRSSLSALASFACQALERISPSATAVAAEGRPRRIFSGGLPRQDPMIALAAVTEATERLARVCPLQCDTVCAAYTTYASVSACAGTPYELLNGSRVSTPGRYTVAAQTAAGCDTTVVTQPSFYPAADLDFEAVPPPCFGDSAGAIRVVPLAAVTQVAVDGMTRAGAAIDGLTGGRTYLVESIDSLGCIQTATVALGPGQPRPNVILPARYAVELGDSVRLGNASLGGLVIEWLAPRGVLECTSYLQPYARPLSSRGRCGGHIARCV